MLKIALSFVFICLVFYFVPIDEIGSRLGQISPITYVSAYFLIMGAVLISSVRLQNLTKRLRLRIAFKDIHRINIYSQIFGMFAFHTIGQMAHRTVYSGKYTSRPQYFAFLTLIEKFVALSTLMALGFIGAYIITENISGNIFGSGSIAILIVILAASLILTYFLLLTEAQRNYISALIRQFFKLQIGRTALLSLIMHLFMLGAYIILAQDLLKETPISVLFGAFSIVMLGASIPISFAGWGLRELSSGFIFIYIGLDSEIGVVVALLIGLLSLAALISHGILIFLVSGKGEHSVPDEKDNKGDKKFHFEKAMAFLGLLFLPLLIGVQVKIPTYQGLLTVNLADPLVIVIALSFAALWVKNYRHNAMWRIKGFSIALICFVALMLYGWLVGFINLGVTDWATYNRLFGLTLIFAYLLGGAFIVVVFKSQALKVIVHIIVATTLVILISFLLTSPMLSSDQMNELGWVTRQLNGLMGNRNALAFLLCLVFAISLAMPNITAGPNKNITLGLTLGLIILTLSRTGIACAAALLLVSWVFKYTRWRNTLTTICIAGLMVLSAYLFLEFYPDLLKAMSGDLVSNKIGKVTTKQFLAVHAERIASYSFGWQMWLENPIFGAGLGAFITEHTKGFIPPLTIHNTALWIAAEMGIIGLLLLAPLPISIVRHIKTKISEKLSWEDFALALVLGTFIVFSLVHEMLYQRGLWFVAGLLCARQFSIYDTLRNSVSREQNQI